MSLRQKTLLIVGITTLILSLGLYLISRTILLKGFSRLEIQKTRTNMERVQNALKAYQSNLETLSMDWAQWDDTYRFVQDRNKNFIDRNFTSSTFEDFHLNLMLFFNKEEKMVYGKAYDFLQKKEIPIPESLKELLVPGSPLFDHPDLESRITGLLDLPEGTLVLSSLPITNSTKEAPPRGVLIFGKFLNPGEVQHLADVTLTSLSSYTPTSGVLPKDVREAFHGLSKEEELLIRPLSKDTLAAYTLLHGLLGKPAILLKAEMNRDTYRQGKATIQFFMLVLLAVLFLMGLIHFFLLERGVLSKVARLSRFVGEISEHSLAKRVQMEGADELSHLADKTNEMLDALERSQKEIKQSRQQLRELADRLEGIREEERTRISRKIDEELGQGLAGIKIDLAWLIEKMPREKEGESEPKASEKMKNLLFRVGKMIQSVRHIVTDLRPSLLDELGLAAALEWQAKEFERKTGIRCRLDLPIEEKDFPSDLATAVFRIFQEILTHILGHAKATEIDIAFQKINNYLLLEVRDNGLGMEPQQTWNPESLGIVGMRERAMAFRGEIDIEGLPEKGTRIALKIPLPILSLKIQ